MFHNSDDQIHQSDRQRVSLTQRLLRVLSEEEYFARQEAERARRRAEDRHAKLKVEERERDRVLHSMRCPKCGMQLEEIAFGDVRIDKCFACEGLWLDKGELDILRQREGGFMARLLSVFG